MIDDIADPIELPVWKDPQNFVIVEHVRDEVWIYFRCWEEPGIDADYIGCLHFQAVWHLESTRFKPTKGYPNVTDTDAVSYYLHVKHSTLLRSLIQNRADNDPDWVKYDKDEYLHYIVESHDFFTHIVAKKVNFFKIDKKDQRHYEKIWEKV